MPATFFLHHVVERVVGSENAVEDAAYAPHDKSERDGKDGDHGQEHKRNLPVDGKRHNPAEREHHGSAHAHADDHHVGILHVGDIGGEACDDRAGRELVDVAKREGLHVVIHIVAQVGGEAHRGTCAHPGAAGAHSKLENGKDEQGDAKRQTSPMLPAWMPRSMRSLMTSGIAISSITSRIESRMAVTELLRYCRRLRASVRIMYVPFCTNRAETT